MKIGPNRTGRPDVGVVYVWRDTSRAANEEPLTRYEWQCWPDTVDPANRPIGRNGFFGIRRRNRVSEAGGARLLGHRKVRNDTKDECEAVPNITQHAALAASRCLPDTVGPRLAVAAVRAVPCRIARTAFQEVVTGVRGRCRLTSECA